MFLWTVIALMVISFAACKKATTTGAPGATKVSAAPEGAKPAPEKTAGQEKKPVAEQAKPTTAPAEKPKPAAVITRDNAAAIIEMANGGRIAIEFYPKDAPNTVDNFIKLANKGFYNGLTFHRVEPGLLVQGGDPRGDGYGGPGYTIKAEFNSRKHVAGTVAMARADDPNSAGSQFYICLTPIPSLDGQYTVFGQVIEGMDVVKGIKPRDVMKKVTIVDKATVKK